MRILYVEDVLVDQQRFVAEGAMRGYHDIVIESQGANAVDRVAAVEPRLVVIDWRLSENQANADYQTKDGVVVGCRVRQRFPNVPVVILTAHNYTAEEKDPKWQDPLMAYISKAAEWDDIFDLISRLAAK